MATCSLGPGIMLRRDGVTRAAYIDTPAEAEVPPSADALAKTCEA